VRYHTGALKNEMFGELPTTPIYVAAQTAEGYWYPETELLASVSLMVLDGSVVNAQLYADLSALLLEVPSWPTGRK